MLSIKIDQDRVSKITDEGNAEDLEKVGEEVTKLEAVFYKPNGKNLSLEFHNLDEKNLHVITGSKLFFKFTEIPAGEKKMVKVKSETVLLRSHWGFGVASVDRDINPVTGKREFSATMFELCPGGKMVKIYKTSSGYTATMEKNNGAKTLCVQKCAKTFNESERLGTKELLKWFKDGQDSKYIRAVLCLIIDFFRSVCSLRWSCTGRRGRCFLTEPAENLMIIN